jgi:hypothetical protein
MLYRNLVMLLLLLLLLTVYGYVDDCTLINVYIRLCNCVYYILHLLVYTIIYYVPYHCIGIGIGDVRISSNYRSLCESYSRGFNKGVCHPTHLYNIHIVIICYNIQRVLLLMLMTHKLSSESEASNY